MNNRFARVLRASHALHVHGPNCPCHRAVAGTRTRLVYAKAASRRLSRSSSPSSPSSPAPLSNHPASGKNDYAFEMASSTIRFGAGATREVGMDLRDWGVKNVCVICDPMLAALQDKASPVQTVLQSIADNKVKYELYTNVRVEPTASSFMDAIKFAREKGPFDAFVAVGGGSTIDTAKAANLYTSFPKAEFTDFVNAPIGKGLPVPGPVKPLIAIPTTAGSGSETTGVAIFDMEHLHAKTGIASRVIKPTLGIVDPLNTLSLPRAPTIASALDQLCHSLESYTALPYHKRPLPEGPALRPAYQGSNPISDVWSRTALAAIAKYLPRAVADPSDLEARSQLMLAATYAGFGFGNAGVHLCHGMSYAVSGLVRPHVNGIVLEERRVYEIFGGEGYPDRPLIPHGVSVCVNAPAVFKFTGPAVPDRHIEVANILSGKDRKVRDEDAGKYLADTIIELMGKLEVPLGLKVLGYSSQDIPDLVKGTLPQHRVIKLSPRPVGEEDLAALFQSAMTY